MNILIVDDEPAIRSVLAMTLQAAANEIHTAPSFDEGIELLKTRTFDLIFLDLRFPTQNSDQTIARIKELRQCAPDATVLAFSGTSEENILDRVLKAGADGFMRKEKLTQVKLLHAALEAATRHGTPYVLDTLNNFLNNPKHQ